VSQIFELGRDENEINNTGFGVNRYRCTSTYGKLWRQRLSATIIRGRVMVVTAAAAWERGQGNGEAPEESSSHSLGSTASSGYRTLVLRP
jgi:hypothetical protein